MLEDKLLTWKYYKNKLPLYLQNSYGFEEHFKLLFNILTNVDEIEDLIFKETNLFVKNYFDNLDIDGITADGTEYNILDWFASLYNVSRKFSVDLVEIIGGVPTTVTYQLNLTNYELLILVMTKIVSTYYDGTYENLKSLYDLIGIQVLFFGDTNASGRASCFLINYENYSSNIQRMFDAGLLIVKSAGIDYSFGGHSTLDYIALWDSNNDLKLWNRGYWS